MPQAKTGGNGESYLRRIFEELRANRRELRDNRRRADVSAQTDRREAAEDRRRAEANAEAFRRQMAAREAERRQRDERFEQAQQDFRDEMRSSHAENRQAWRDVRTVGVAIIRTLNRQTRILEHSTRLLQGIDRKLVSRRNGHGGNQRHR